MCAGCVPVATHLCACGCASFAFGPGRPPAWPSQRACHTRARERHASGNGPAHRAPTSANLLIGFALTRRWGHPWRHPLEVGPCVIAFFRLGPAPAPPNPAQLGGRSTSRLPLPLTMIIHPSGGSAFPSARARASRERQRSSIFCARQLGAANRGQRQTNGVASVWGA